MPPLFRYFSKKNAEAFVENGEVLFRALSYFRDYEDAGVRSDPHEGTLIHLPCNGLQVTKQATGEVINLPHRLESTVKEDAIFIYCMSTELSPEIIERFNAERIVEITDPVAFLALVKYRLSIRKRLRIRELVHQKVQYYEWNEPPLADWAIPERIAMRKPETFSWQKEYRIAVPLGDAFRVENVSVSLVPSNAMRLLREASHPFIKLKLGNLSKICRVHYP
jgi:hypothetical protein